MTEIATDDRLLSFEGLDNVRDVGGLPLRDGGETSHGVLLRSAALEYLTPADVRWLVEEFGLRQVLDLRTPHEVELHGAGAAVTEAGVQRVELTFIGASRDALPEDTELTVLQTYRGYLTDHPANVVEAVRRIAAPDAAPTLVHCAAGKDRTGTLVALVLDAVGVERDAVVADYALSAAHVEALFRRWTAASGDPMPDDIDRHKPRAATMVTFLEELDEQYGGAAGWLTANGLADEELERLRSRLVAG